MSRRTLARSTAWATPVLLTSVAAPAYAASGVCVPSKSTLVAGTSPLNLTFPPSNVSATVAYSATNANGTARSDSTPGETGEVHTTLYSPSWNYLKLHLPKQLQQGQTVTLTLTFSQPVQNLSLKITDIDKDTTSWIDEVVVSPLGFTAVKGANVVGTGVSGAPFTSSVNGGIDSALGDVALNWAGQVTQVVITYRAADKDGKSDIGQHIGVGEISFGC